MEASRGEAGGSLGLAAALVPRSLGALVRGQFGVARAGAGSWVTAGLFAGGGGWAGATITVAFLQRVPLFAGLAAEELHDLVAVMQPIELAPGQLPRAGDGANPRALAAAADRTGTLCRLLPRHHG